VCEFASFSRLKYRPLKEARFLKVDVAFFSPWVSNLNPRYGGQVDAVQLASFTLANSLIPMLFIK
ncbi:hypothetical protein B5G52_21450, partial [Pseudoalteromonas sp. A601]|uniref:hypothetical protein n=1 Tax=Pseudoalteromonas sp. A601 TaxID=1967839 RepID=UPI000B56A36E